LRRASSNQRTRHNHIRYIIVAEQAEMSPCVSEMVADFFTKLFQGNIFRQFRKLIFNLSEFDDDLAHDAEVHRSVLREQAEMCLIHVLGRNIPMTARAIPRRRRKQLDKSVCKEPKTKIGVGYRALADSFIL
jgi:hypothetical protein